MKKVNSTINQFAPSKIVCVGRNYIEHIHELHNEIPQNLVLFLKPNSALSHELFFISEDCRFEGEICFVVEEGKLAQIGFGLDLTKANIQNYLKQKGLPWERAKGFDKSAVFGTFVPLRGDIQTLQMKLWLNGSLQQHATYNLMIYKPDVILQEIQSFMSLEDGDIIMTGTPKGVTTYKQGDKIEATIYIDNQPVVSEIFYAK